MSIINDSKLETFLLKLQNFSNTDFTKNEANTKKRVIEPLIELLGWEFDSNEVQLEYPISTGTSTTHVDYAFLLEGKPVVLLEAKPFDIELAEKESRQIISYGKLEDIKWVALTNGDELKLFDTSRGKNEELCLISKIQLLELPKGVKEFSIFHRNSILSGEIETIVNRIAQTKSAIKNLRTHRIQLKEKIKESILSITGDILKERIESISLQLSKQAIEMIEKQIDSTPERVSGKIPEIYRDELRTRSSGEVIVASSRAEGMEFIEKYNAWGFLTLSDSKTPKYFSLYVGAPESKILYFSEIEKITKPIESVEDIKNIEEEDIDEPFPTGKRVLYFKKGSLVRFKDPIILENRRAALRGHRYTTIEKLINAKNVNDL